MEDFNCYDFDGYGVCVRKHIEDASAEDVSF